MSVKKACIEKEKALKKENERLIGLEEEINKTKANLQKTIKDKADELSENKRKELEKEYSLKTASYGVVLLGCLLYSIVTTCFTAVRSEVFVSDFKAFFTGIWGFIAKGAELLRAGADMASRLGDMIPQEVIAMLVHWILWLIIVIGVVVGIGIFVFIAVKKLYFMYKDNYADNISLVFLLLSLSILIYFAEPIRSIIKLNLLFMFFIANAIFIVVRYMHKNH